MTMKNDNCNIFFWIDCISIMYLQVRGPEPEVCAWSVEASVVPLFPSSIICCNKAYALV